VQNHRDEAAADGFVGPHRARDRGGAGAGARGNRPGPAAEAAAARGIRRFVFTSTTALYGSGSAIGEPAQWVDEATPPRPRSIYHRTQWTAEQVLGEVAARRGLALTLLRMSRCFPEPLPLMAVYRLHRGIDERDVAAAHALALAHDGPGEVRCFVVSGATPFLPADAEWAGTDAPGLIRRRVPALTAAFDARGWPLPARLDRIYDAGRARRSLGWTPRHGWAGVLA
jgi:UDP-glucose 4-epimerase